jgi:tetratricopeptide (TPR) repeat protein
MNISNGRNRRTIAVILLILALQATVFAQTDPDGPGFAESLMSEGDYFRAISEYKLLLFYSTDAGLSQYYDSRIAFAYLKSSHFLLSISYLDRLMKLPEVSDELLFEANLLYGINFYCLHENAIAAGYFQKAQPADKNGTADLFLGLLLAENGDWKGANRSFMETAGKTGSAENGTVAIELATSVLKGESLDSRSPVLAGLLSAVLPGSGQAYCGHWFDALSAFTMVGLFGFATFLAYSYDAQQNNGHYVYTAIGGSITAVFYLSNILGATKTAGYYTAKKRQDFMDGIRARVFDTVR